MNCGSRRDTSSTTNAPSANHQHFGLTKPPTLIATTVICGICGRYRFDNFARDFLLNLRDKGDNRLYRISHTLPTIADKSEETRDYSNVPIYSTDDLKEMLDRQDPAVQDKLNILLKHLSTVSAFPGDRQEFDNTSDYSVLCAKNSAEADFYMNSLHEHGLLAGPALKTRVGTTFSLSAKGWIELQKIAECSRQVLECVCGNVVRSITQDILRSDEYRDSDCRVHAY